LGDDLLRILLLLVELVLRRGRGTDFLDEKSSDGPPPRDEPAHAGGENIGRARARTAGHRAAGLSNEGVGDMAGDVAAGAGVAYPLDMFATMVARLVLEPAADAASTSHRRPVRRLPPQLVSPGLTDHR
jgi:hypothetical protein